MWNVHLAFRTPVLILPQFVELPDGSRFFTISRSAERPAINAKKLRYAAAYNLDDERLFSRIGINCHLCPRQACTQRPHQPVFMELPIDTSRRGNTRYES